MKLLKSVIGPILFLILILLFSRFIISIEYGPINVLKQQLNSFDLKDIYFNSLKAETTCDPNIVVIGTDSLNNREEIAAFIDTLSSLNPAVIGIDLFFAKPKNNDSVLISCLKKNKNKIVLGSILENNKIKYSYFTQKYNFENGLVSFDDALEEYPKTPIRSIKNRSANSSDATSSSFSLKTLEIALKNQKKSFTHLQKLKEKEQLLINYPLNKPFIINSTDELALSADFIRGKIIIMGDLNNSSDIFSTPFYNASSKNKYAALANLPGVVIHAIALDSIKNETYFRSNSWFNNFVILLFSFIIFLCLGQIHIRFHESYDLWARLFQLGASLLLIFIYFAILHYCRYDLNFGILFVVLVFASDSIEIYSGIKHHYSKFIKRFK